MALEHVRARHFGARHFATLGRHASIVPPAVPPATTFGLGGQRIHSGGSSIRARYKRDDELIWMGRK
jgi:hypothetical protein